MGCRLSTELPAARSGRACLQSLASTPEHLRHSAAPGGHDLTNPRPAQAAVPPVRPDIAPFPTVRPTLHPPPALLPPAPLGTRARSQRQEESASAGLADGTGEWRTVG